MVIGDNKMIEDLNNKLKTMIDEHRYKHSIGVQETAVKLAVKYGADVHKASIAGLLHDCAKGLSNETLLSIAEKHCAIEIDYVYRYQPALLHGAVGAYIAERDFLIRDKEIIHSIEYHTTGCVNMSLLDKIIYIADYIEPGRDFQGVDMLREQTFQDLNKGVVLALSNTLKHVIESGHLIHILTVQARNYMLINYFSD